MTRTRTRTRTEEQAGTDPEANGKAISHAGPCLDPAPAPATPTGRPPHRPGHPAAAPELQQPLVTERAWCQWH
ncbi:hypothetical protein [Streptomyces sp. NRRL S-448]|uniref:hypothetical protein n=1 Tax=Streptomyces sp. NRRL S-448 TaxID=1463907 RepID=UPI000A9D8FCD